jgi:hypothetical protein
MEKKYVVLVAVALLASAAAVAAGTQSTSTSVSTPSGCVKPADGFLIIASQLGYNDSVDHGVPANSWPVMNVKVGQNVTIIVCNEDPAQAHGFNIDYYYNNRIVSVGVGQVLRVSFIAGKAGSFRVYCNIFCTVHWAMQSGKLVVS